MDCERWGFFVFWSDIFLVKLNLKIGPEGQKKTEKMLCAKNIVNL